jgi:1-acyl-sn-glycerol-3-phosphate acyltransferase
MLTSLRLLVHLLRGWWIIRFRFPRFDQDARRASIMRWGAQLLDVMGITLQTQGSFPDRACVIACNHISWLDVFLIQSKRPAAFVAKQEAGKWPLIGTLLRGTDTALIDRGRRHAVHAVITDLVHRLQAESTVAFFPEGTTSDGSGLLTFHANFFEASMRSRALLVPVTVKYFENGERSRTVEFVGDTSLLQSIRSLINKPGIQARLIIHAPLNPADFSTRHELAQAARLVILASLDAP